LKVWTTSVVGSGLVCLAVPTLSWAVTIGGQVVPLNQTKNQPTLNIQITGVTRPGIGFSKFDKDNLEDNCQPSLDDFGCRPASLY
jgi:hypothetical protein